MHTPIVRLLAALLGLGLIVAAVWHLEAARAGISMTPLMAGTTPATVYRRSDAPPAPAVIIAHGFAGSRQLMEAYALTLARAGYVAVSFDSEGHGRNEVPMSGAVDRIDGTTELLKRELGRVTDAVLALPVVDGRLALLGHSMASDIVVRRALEDPRVAATVAISMFSEAVTRTAPRDLLMISGGFEGTLRAGALRHVRQVDAAAGEDQTVGDPAAGTGRRAAVAPGVEHVSVLYSEVALREARDWLDAVFGRRSDAPVAATGPWVLLLLAGIVILAWPLAQLLPAATVVPGPQVPWSTFLPAVIVPALLTPLLLRLVDTRFLPVLVADYLAAHLFVYGLLTIGLLYWRGLRIGRIAWPAALALGAYGIIVLGGALDRYVASTMPTAARLPVIAAIAVGAIAFMLADSLVASHRHGSAWRVLIARAAFLASLLGAVALDFWRLMFLLMIVPVIIAYFLVFGSMGGWVTRRTGSPAAAGLALGVILAWLIGVSFPMFVAP